ncbi:MAG TPA: hypothetical protein VMH83_01025 [Candidatus Acidoferrum sp.]|nr:hypothetical protein [Candidatus Acidoferrum sp.]
MKTKLIAVTLFASVLAHGTAFAACAKPDEPDVPKGDSASGADMLKAKKAVETYVADIQKYMACGIASAEQDRAQKKMQDIANAFNEQLRIYKAKS